VQRFGDCVGAPGERDTAAELIVEWEMVCRGRLSLIALCVITVRLCAAGPQHSGAAEARIDDLGATRSRLRISVHALDRGARAHEPAARACSQGQAQHELRKVGPAWRRMARRIGSPEGATKFFLFGTGALEAIDLLSRSSPHLLTKHKIHGWIVSAEVCVCFRLCLWSLPCSCL
jgi:hypothetical protein